MSRIWTSFAMNHSDFNKEQRHRSNDILDNHSTASALSSYKRRRPPGNAVSEHCSSMRLVS